MNKYQKAYEILLEVWQGDKTEEEGFPDYDDINEALYEIGELVNKETPMKVIANAKLARNQYKYICPNCKKFLFSANSQVIRLIGHQENYKHCAFCGQRLDWSDSE